MDFKVGDYVRIILPIFVYPMAHNSTGIVTGIRFGDKFPIQVELVNSKVIPCMSGELQLIDLSIFNELGD